MTDEQRAESLARICDDMLTDYLVCAEDRHVLDGHIDPFTSDNRPIIERIGGTLDGMRIRRYIERLRELGVDA